MFKLKFKSPDGFFKKENLNGPKSNNNEMKKSNSCRIPDNSPDANCSSGIEKLNPTSSSGLLLSSSWVPPNDRELIIRARLKTGWSSRSFKLNSNEMNTNTNNNNNNSKSPETSNNSKLQPLISDNEFIEIEQVLQRAAMIENKELNRINKLYHRYNSMNRPQGNGETTCLICNCNFGILGATPKICSDCLKNICSTCSIDTLSSSKQTTIWLCKICAEYRDLLKKSGAWFNKRMPHLQLPIPVSLSNSTNFNSPVKSPSNSNIASTTSNSNISDFAKTKSTNNSQYNISSNSDSLYTDRLKKDKLSEHESLSRLTTESKKPCGKTNCDESESEDVFKSGLLTSNYERRLREHEESSDVDSESSFSRLPAGKPRSVLSSSSFENLNEKITKASSNYSIGTKTNNELILDSLRFELKDENLKSEKKHSLNDIHKVRASNTKNDLDTASSKNSLSSNSHNMPHSNSNYNLANNVNSNSKKNSLSKSSADSASIHSFSSITNKKNNLKLGSLQFTVEYVPSLLQLKIHLISASSLPARDSNGLSDPYVKIHLLPGVAKATKLRSKTVYKNLNPVYNETLQYDGITLQDLDTKTLRLTVLDEDKFGFDFIGEYRLPLKALALNEVNNFNVDLEDKQDLGDETDATSRGKINFALKYSKTSNCLYVKINRCKQLLPMDNGKSSDPFVEISLLPSQKENKQKFKTSTKWKTLEPEFYEEFKFTNLDLKTLLNKQIQIAVWDKDFGKNDFIGTVLLGQQRTGEELKHFFTIIKNPDIYHEQWHTLHLKDNEEPHE